VITLFVDDLDAVVEGIASRGVEPPRRETYSNGVRKATYRNPDGNEIGYGGSPTGQLRRRAAASRNHQLRGSSWADSVGSASTFCG